MVVVRGGRKEGREEKTREEEFLRADRRVFGARVVWVWPLDRVGRVFSVMRTEVM